MIHWSSYNIIVEQDEVYSLLFNTRTGAMLRLDRDRREEMVSALQNASVYRDLLCQMGFAVEDGVDELSLLAAANEEAHRDPGRFAATIELTQACNFRCTYCYQEHKPDHMAVAVSRKVIEFLTHKMDRVPRVHVNWFGGEPLLALNTLVSMSKQLREEAGRRSCVFSQFIATNGYGLTKRVASLLKEIGIQSVQITIDGDQPCHDQTRRHISGGSTYERILGACTAVVEHGMDLLVRVNVSRLNANSINGLLLDLNEQGVSPRNTRIHITRAVDHGNCSECIAASILSVEEFAGAWVNILRLTSSWGYPLPQLNPIAFNCPFDLHQTVMISTDGTLCYCSSSSEPIGHFCDIESASYNPPDGPTPSYRSPLNDAKCRSCIYLPLCMGGCGLLERLGQNKCSPERYVISDLIRLTAGEEERERNKRKEGGRHGD